MTEQTARKVPSIRFKGFEGEWKKYKLGSISECYSGGTPSVSSKSFYNGKIPFIRSGEINSNTTEITINESGLNNSSAKLVSKGCILYALYGATSGEVGISKIDGAINQAILAIKPNKNYSVEFIEKWLRKQKNFIVKTFLQGGQGNLSGEIIKSLMLPVPAPEEQTKIGTYFKNLDQLIELHQQKYKKLLTLKKAMLQKMFPKEGATSPEIRFKGFDECWKKKSLEAVCEIIGGGTPSTAVPDYWGGDIDWYSPTEIGSKVYASGSTKKITKLGFEKSSARMLPADKTILFTSRAGIGDMAILKKSGCTNQGFQSLVLLDGADTYFIYSMGYLIKDYALRHASGSTFLEISSKQLRKMEILLPSEKEQQKIGNYFRKLDTLISQQATQLKKLKQIKAACLEKMFV